MQDFFNNLDWTMFLKAFMIGGSICVIGQILIDKTKLTPARILVVFVTTGVVLGGLGIYQKLVDFAGAGATVPLTGFGNLLAKGAIEKVKSDGFIGAFTGGTAASAGGIAAAVFFRIYRITSIKAKNKETMSEKQFGNNLGTPSKKNLEKPKVLFGRCPQIVFYSLDIIFKCLYFFIYFSYKIF